MDFRALAPLFAFLILVSTPLSGQAFALPDSAVAGNKPVRLLEYEKKLWLVTERHLYRQKGATLEQAWTAPTIIRDAEAVNGNLWLATDDGLWKKAGHDAPPQRTRVVRKGVTALAPGADKGTLVVATADEGAMTLRDTAVLRIWVQNTRIEDACMLGGFMWLGTESGLLRISAADSSVQKYAEEGVAGFEIPDNIIERLFAGRGTVLTIVMPQALAFLPVAHGEAPAHGRHFDYLGEPNNSVRDLAQNKAGDLVFCTDKGVLWLSGRAISEPESSMAGGEVYDSRNNPRVQKLALARLLPDAAKLPAIWDAVFFDRGGNLWLANAQTVLRIPRKKLPAF